MYLSDDNLADDDENITDENITSTFQGFWPQVQNSYFLEYLWMNISLLNFF